MNSVIVGDRYHRLDFAMTFKVISFEIQRTFVGQNKIVVTGVGHEYLPILSTDDAMVWRSRTGNGQKIAVLRKGVVP